MSNTQHAHHVLVPVKPTPEMLLAGHHKIDWCRDGQKTNVMEDASQVEIISGQTIGTTCKQDLTDAWEAMLAVGHASHAVGVKGDVDLDLYDPKVQLGMAWTLRQVGKQLGAESWAMGDGSESVEGDVAAEIGNIMRAAGLIDDEGEPLGKATYAMLRRLWRCAPFAIHEEVPAEAGSWIKRALRFIDLCDADGLDYADNGLRNDAERLTREGFALFGLGQDNCLADLEHLALRAPMREPKAITDIAAERQRQIEAEGRTPDADDGYRNGELASAASAYAFSAATRTRYLALDPLGFWPWAPEWFKPKDQRSDLVRAGALIVAEIERFDRAQLRADEDDGAADCPICKVRFKADDLCLTDIDLGPCHAECLADSPAVDLDSGELLPEGAPPPTPYRYDLTGRAAVSDREGA